MKNLDGLERSKIIEELILERGYFCEMCSRVLSIIQNHPKQRQVHHIIPLRYGGTWDKENLFLCCLECHRKIEFLIGCAELVSSTQGSEE